jgi:shikimate dehydrogenase
MPGSLTFRLVGHGIAYSASPAMMNAAFEAVQVPHRYVLADVADADVPATVAILRAPEAGGANVTVPYKGAVVPFLDDITDIAREADAVNTIVRRDGRLIGHNTDVPAMMDVLRGLRPGGSQHVVVIGAGGASRAVQFALTKLGVREITVLRRTDGSIERLPRHLHDADLLINATPVGTGTDDSPVPAGLLRTDLAVLDLVYRPNPTRLVLDALAAGAVAESGSSLLLGQAWRAFELWLERPAPIDVMRSALAHELENHDV